MTVWYARRATGIMLLLIAAVFATRVGHFGGAVSMPDATLAAFFLAGLAVPSRWTFAMLLGTAAVADHWALLQGVSDWCVTPAYPFLVPTYACLWIGGRACRRLDMASLADFARLGGLLFAACAAAFVLSNGSFFLFSGYFDAMPVGDYWRATVRYFVPYASWTFAYVAIAFGVAALASRTARAWRAGTRA